MRLTRVFFILSLFAMTSFSYGQGFAVLLYSSEQLITDACEGGDFVPDGTVIKVFWDANGNGPDTTDAQPVEGAGPMECNFNQFTVNGAGFGLPGGFFTETAFSIPTGVPDSPSYYLKICLDANELQWVTDTFVVSAGLQERIFGNSLPEYVPWSCVNEACGGCPTPVPVTNLTADTTSCQDVLLNWDHADDVTGYRVRVDEGADYFISSGLTTEWLDTVSPAGVHFYRVRAYLVCDQDTSYSSYVEVQGRRVQGPPIPLNMTASDDLCGTVHLAWTVNTILGLDSFRVYRGTEHIASLERGNAGQARTYNDNAPLQGPQNYCIYGLSSICSLGTPACDIGQGGVTPGTVSDVAATTDRCDSVVVTWTYALGDADSFQVFRNTTGLTPYVSAAGGPNYRFAHQPTAGQQGGYQIRAVNDCGVGALAPTTPVIGTRMTSPGQVQSIVASDTLCDGVNVTWAAMANIDSFQIRMNGNRIGVVLGDIEEYFDGAAVAGVTNTYTVVAYNDCGAGQVAAGNAGTRRAPGTGTATFAMTQAGPPNWTYSMTVTSGCLNQLVIRDFCEGTTATAPTGWTVSVTDDSIIYSSTDVFAVSETITGFGLSHPTCDGDGRWGTGQSGGTIRGPLPVGSNAELPTEYALKVFPNPFNPQTTLHLAIPMSSETRVLIFNITGQLVRDQNFGRLQAGYHSLRFDGADLPSGMYFARVQSGTFQNVQKLMLLK
ncbi:T9SS type A sorting domain-containing protein [bacterium]|nr:T9SS type A sorting domain-containing protein [bacterium]